MSPSETNAAGPSSVAGRSTKSSKQSKVVILRLSSTQLGRFPTTTPTSDPPADTKSKSASSPSPIAMPSAAAASSVDNASDTASTPVPPTDPPAPKAMPGPKPGAKRASGADTIVKPRNRPGPKKKPRLEDGTIDNSARPTGPGHGSHRLGPRANQGAINAGLRALDRSGKPCRKWERKSFQLKSFTGVTWEVPSWRAPPKSQPAEEPRNNSNGEAVPAEEADGSKANRGTSAIHSDKSNSGEGDNTPFQTVAESSPAPILPAAS